MADVTELPVGQYDATRTLRHLLARAEKGEIKQVLVICDDGGKPPDGKGEETHEVWASWSDMDAVQVWWLASWLISYLRRRYFSGHGIVRDEDEAG